MSWLLSTEIRKIAVVGDSAGGGLALATLAALRHATGRPSAVAGVTFSLWVELAFTGRSMTDPNVEDPLLSYDFLRDFAHEYLGGADPRDPRASPLFGELADLPPLLIQEVSGALVQHDMPFVTLAQLSMQNVLPPIGYL